MCVCVCRGGIEVKHTLGNAGNELLRKLIRMYIRVGFVVKKKKGLISLEFTGNYINKKAIIYRFSLFNNEVKA